jgi:hypothetical protein
MLGNSGKGGHDARPTAVAFYQTVGYECHPSPLMRKEL